MAATAMVACLWMMRDVNIVVLLLLAPLLYGVALLSSGCLTARELKPLGLDRILKNAGLYPRVTEE